MKKNTILHKIGQLIVPLKRTMSPLEADSHSACGGHFFNRSLLLLLLMLTLGMNATADEVTEQTFQYGLRQLVNTNSPMFMSDREALAPSQIEMLRAIKDGVQQLSSTEAKRSYALGNPNTISKNKKVLKDKDIIEERRGKLVFVDPVYRLWFSQDY